MREKYRKSKIGVIPDVSKGFPGTRKKICLYKFWNEYLYHSWRNRNNNGIRNMWNFGHCSANNTYYLHDHNLYDFEYMSQLFTIHSNSLKIIIFIMWYNVIRVVKSNTTFKIILELLLFIVIYYTRATVKYIIKHSYNVYVSSLYIIM